MTFLGEIDSGFGIISVLVRLLLAMVLGGFIGMERELHGRASGLRTHMLICIGAAMTSLTSVYVASCTGLDGDIFRISAQVISGIGFIGAGAILVKKTSVITGLTTAAGMWVTAAIGVAAGYGFYSGAVISCALLLITVYVFRKLEKRMSRPKRIYIELRDLSLVNYTIEQINKVTGRSSSSYILPPKSSADGHIGFSVRLDKSLDADLVIKELCKIENVVFAVRD